jgi:hypothetical protein
MEENNLGDRGTIEGLGNGESIQNKTTTTKKKKEIMVGSVRDKEKGRSPSAGFPALSHQNNPPKREIKNTSAQPRKASDCLRLDVSNGDLDLNSGLDGDRGDLLDNLLGGVEIDDPLVDPHLEPVPGVGTLTARRLPAGDKEVLGGETDGALHLEVLLVSLLEEVGANPLEVLDVPRGEGDTDAVGAALLNSFGSLLLRHVNG